MNTVIIPKVPEGEEPSQESLIALFREEAEAFAEGKGPKDSPKCPSIVVMSVICDCPATLALGFKGFACQKFQPCIVRKTLFKNGTFS